MNIDNNQRFKDTERKILSAYGTLAANKAIAKISVSDICKEAQIHRTTFYGHFQDVFELQNYVESIQLKKLFDSFITEDGWNLREGILAQLKFYYSHQKIIKKNFVESGSINQINNFFAYDFSADFKRSYKQRFNLNSDTEIAYHQSFISVGSSAIIRKWILSDCNESPEEIADFILKVLF